MYIREKNRKQTKIFKENVQQCEEDNDDDGKEITEKNNSIICCILLLFLFFCFIKCLFSC